MGNLGLEIGWEVDDVDGAKRAFLRADTAADTQAFRDICDFGLWGDFYAEFAGADDRAGLFAFLPTFLHMVSNDDRSGSGNIMIPLACTVEQKINR